MMSSSNKDDEEFWYSTEKRSFSFDSNEVHHLFGSSSKDDAQKLWAGITDVPTPDDLSKPSDDAQDFKPLFAVISDRTASCVLSVDKVLTSIAESNTVQVTATDVTLQKILLGQPYSLEPYKSHVAKVSLLDAAIESGDGNAILIIILFLTRTIKRSLLQRILAERPVAVNIYVHYLSIRLRVNEIIDILNMLGHTLDSAMKHLHIIIRNTRDPDRLSQKLESCYKTQFSTLSDRKEASFLLRYIGLLEWQKASKEKTGDEQLKFDSPVLECLRYSCKDHWNCPSGTPISAHTLFQQHEISPRQYQKCMLLARASIGAWDDVDRLFPTKGWLGSKKLQTSLRVEDILKTLHKYHAPVEMLEKFLKYVDDTEKRLHLATNLRCYRTVIDILVTQGDRSGLLDYKEKLEPQSEEYFYVESALRLPSVKWKS